MDSDDSTTKLCSNYWCKGTLPQSSTAKTCELCREFNRKAQKENRIRKREQDAVGIICTTAQAGNKRKPQMGHDSDRPLRSQKTQKLEELDGETEDEDEFYGEWPDSKELNEKVGTKYYPYSEAIVN